jgi:hypothetical protein
MYRFDGYSPFLMQIHFVFELFQTCDPIKKDIFIKSNQKENKDNTQILYEYKVGDQVLSETPRNLRKLSTPCTGPYPVTNKYKNGTITIQEIKRELYQKE